MLRTSLASILLMLAGGCGGDGSVPDQPDAGAELSAQCMEATQHSDLAWIQDNVFTPSCAAFNACHKGAALSAGGLNLEAGQAETNLLGRPSGLFPDYELLVAGQPDASYLMVILGGEQGPLSPDVGMMPFSGAPLCDEKVDAIRRWIESM